MSKRLTAVPPRPATQDGLPPGLPSGLQESMKDVQQEAREQVARSMRDCMAPAQRPADAIPHVIPGPTVPLNARISPELMSRLKAFCATEQRSAPPERVTIQEFIVHAIRRQLGDAV